jgi:hypothetical protein
MREPACVANGGTHEVFASGRLGGMSQTHPSLTGYVPPELIPPSLAPGEAAVAVAQGGALLYMQWNS